MIKMPTKLQSWPKRFRHFYVKTTPHSTPVPLKQYMLAVNRSCTSYGLLKNIVPGCGGENLLRLFLAVEKSEVSQTVLSRIARQDCRISFLFSFFFTAFPFSPPVPPHLLLLLLNLDFSALSFEEKFNQIGNLYQGVYVARGRRINFLELHF